MAITGDIHKKVSLEKNNTCMSFQISQFATVLTDNLGLLALLVVSGEAKSGLVAILIGSGEAKSGLAAILIGSGEAKSVLPAIFVGWGRPNWDGG